MTTIVASSLLSIAVERSVHRIVVPFRAATTESMNSLDVRGDLEGISNVNTKESMLNDATLPTVLEDDIVRGSLMLN